MKIIRFFLIWQDEKEETWLNNLSLNGLRLESVQFPFTYLFSEHSQEKYAYHLNAPKDSSLSLVTFKNPYQESGWEHIGQMNGWHYFRKAYSGDTPPVFGQGDATKADKYQKSMMLLVGLLPFLLIIFPVVGKRFAPPLYDLLKFIYFFFLALYTLITFKVYRRVIQIRDK